MNCLRVIESTLPVELASTLDAHANSLRSLGWVVRDVFAPRRDQKQPQLVHEIASGIIWPWLDQNPERPHVFVIGDVPIPRSGFMNNPDGHHDTNGAYPCPAYFATGPDGWTDHGDNRGYPSRPALKHGPGDFVWDQDVLPASARCAVGILNLTPSAKNKSWGFTGPQSRWLTQAYRRYFDSLLRWRNEDIREVGVFANGHYNSPTGSGDWLRKTHPDQPIFRSPTSPRPFTGPYRFIFDFKALPPNGDFWFKRTSPVAAVYLEWESYQTDWNVSRIQNALMSGSACAAPVGFEFIMDGWETKTVGELWQQSATKGRRSWISLYGDPAFQR